MQNELTSYPLPHAMEITTTSHLECQTLGRTNTNKNVTIATPVSPQNFRTHIKHLYISWSLIYFGCNSLLCHEQKDGLYVYCIIVFSLWPDTTSELDPEVDAGFEVVLCFPRKLPKTKYI